MWLSRQKMTHCSPHAEVAAPVRVSNAFVDITFACAAHVEASMGAEQERRPWRHMRALDDDILIAGQIEDTGGMLREIQVCLLHPLSLSV